MSKNTNHTVTFTLTEAQSKKWEEILQSKDGIKTLTSSLRELGKLQKFKEAQLLKKQKKKNCREGNTVPQSDAYKTQHLKQHHEQITEICEICRAVYEGFHFSGKEHHYQAALEAELRDMGFLVQQEVSIHAEQLRNLHFEQHPNPFGDQNAHRTPHFQEARQSSGRL